MALQCVSGLANAGFGFVYWNIAPKFSLLSKIPLKAQMSAFSLSAIVQVIFTTKYPPQENEGLSLRRAFEVFTPYVLISSVIYLSHRQALKATIICSAILGTVQLAVSQLSPMLINAIFSKDVVIGKDDWACLGDVGEVPSMPENMAQVFSEKDPFDPEKQVRDNYMLVLIPQTVDGKPLTLNLLSELIQTPTGKPATSFDYYPPPVQAELGGVAVTHSYWVLMRKDVIPGSRSKTYDQQKQLVQDAEGSNCQIPGALEATAGILMYYFKTGKILYGQNPWTYTRCQETVTTNQWPVAIGGFSPGGLYVFFRPFGLYDCHGVAVVRKF